MRSNLLFIGLLAAAGAWAQAPGSSSSVRINLPPDSPVTLVSADWGELRATPRGGAMQLDLRAALQLRNAGPRRVRGITLLVLAQNTTPGGKASVSVPSLDVGPGEVFPVRVDLRLLRPLGGGPLVEVGLDGVLFEDLSFFGPDRLNSRRLMTAWELEARRDRRYFRSILEARGPEGLRNHVLAALARQSERPRLDVRMARGGRATNAEPEREVQVAFLRLPDAPVEPVTGLARISGNEVRAPRIEVRNRSDRTVRHLEIGWILRDRQGREFLAGSVPAGVSLAPGGRASVAPETALRVSERAGQPVPLEGMTGFVSQVEFSDGKLWIPTRHALADPRLERLAAPSPEEQRLTEIYRKKGLPALVEELKRLL
ncbi:MAG: hypothetical protein HY822_24565 [Acidobacteria bacterium]|nr:hypothetical protein [Acidobacteriota bacterium]